MLPNYINSENKPESNESIKNNQNIYISDPLYIFLESPEGLRKIKLTQKEFQKNWISLKHTIQYLDGIIINLNNLNFVLYCLNSTEQIRFG